MALKLHVRTLYQIGGSLGITLPTAWIKSKLLNHGSRLFITEEPDKIIIETINPQTTEKLQRFGMEMLLNKNRRGANIISSEAKTKSQKTYTKGGAKWD